MHLLSVSAGLTCRLNLEFKITLVLVKRSIGKATASSTYPSPTLNDDHIGTCRARLGNTVNCRQSCAQLYGPLLLGQLNFTRVNAYTARK